MEIPEFDKIVDGILLPSINRARIAFSRKEKRIGLIPMKIEFLDLIYAKYQRIRARIYKDFMNEETERIDRHKIAGIFYTAFVDVSKDRKYADFKSVPHRYRPIFAHDIAFNIAMGILESFIISAGEKDEQYIKHIDKNGLISTQTEKHKSYTIREFLLAHKYTALSPILLANIFYSIERISEDEFNKLQR